MDLDRLSTGEKIAGASGILLFVFMFFDWFGAEVSGGGGGFLTASATASANAWDALDVIPIFLVIAIVAAVGVAILRLSDAVFEPAIPANAVVAVLGGLAVLLILYRIVDPPGGTDVPGLSVDVSPEFGIFLALLAAIGIAYGGYSAMKEEGVTFGDTADRLGGTPAPPPSDPAAAPPSAPPPPPPPPPPSSGA